MAVDGAEAAGLPLWPRPLLPAVLSDLESVGQGDDGAGGPALPAPSIVLVCRHGPVGRPTGAVSTRPFTAALDKKDPKSPFRDQIVHVAFLPERRIAPDALEIGMTQVWQMDQKVPVLDQEQRIRIVALGGGQYFLDIRYRLAAGYGNVNFVSDAVHYAWPYVRMHPQFSVDHGGRITNSEGGVNQKGTCSKEAHWVDYSNTSPADRGLGPVQP